MIAKAMEIKMFERVEINPRICGGKPIIKGTRIPVGVLLEQISTGESWEDILRGYPELTREDLQAAILFAKAFMDSTEIVPSGKG